MDTKRLAPIYLFGIVLNVGALVYSILNEQYLMASAFVFVLLYLGVRYRML